MTTIREVEQLLNDLSLLPHRTETLQEAANHNQPLIGRTLAVVMDWLAIQTDPQSDVNGLQTGWNALIQSHANHYDADLAKTILQRLIPFLREFSGFSTQERENARLGLTTTPSFTDLMDIDTYITYCVYHDTLVAKHPQRLAFYALWTTMPCGIESKHELVSFLERLRTDEVIAIIQQYNPTELAKLLTRSRIEEPKKAVCSFVGRVVANHPDINELRFATHLVERMPDNFDIVMAQTGFISQSMPADYDIAFRQKFWNVHKALEQLRHDNQATKALRLTNQILLSTPGDARQYLLTDYQLLANTMIGHRNPKWQATGIAMVALGAAVAALGFATIISGGAIPIALGITALIVGVGIFAANRQKGASKIMQVFHDEIEQASPNAQFIRSGL